jgi:DNA-directed RNA polymerase specialized sigma24 family protein
VKPPAYPDSARDPELEELICDCLDLLLTTLAPEQANIVRRIDVEGEMPEDVAHTLKLSLSAVTRQLMCGRQTLKDRFAAMYLVCPKHGLAGCDCNQANRAKP